MNLYKYLKYKQKYLNIKNMRGGIGTSVEKDFPITERVMIPNADCSDLWTYEPDLLVPIVVEYEDPEYEPHIHLTYCNDKNGYILKIVKFDDAQLSRKKQSIKSFKIEVNLSKVMYTLGVGPKIEDAWISGQFGIMIQEKLDFTLDDYILGILSGSIPFDPSEIYNIFAHLYKLVFKLVNDHHFFHQDLHLKNIMFRQVKSSDLKLNQKFYQLRLIDFDILHYIENYPIFNTNERLSEFPFIEIGDSMNTYADPYKHNIDELLNSEIPSSLVTDEISDLGSNITYKKALLVPLSHKYIHQLYQSLLKLSPSEDIENLMKLNEITKQNEQAFLDTIKLKVDANTVNPEMVMFESVMPKLEELNLSINNVEALESFGISL